MSLLKFQPIDRYPRPGDRVILAPGALDVRERPGFVGPGSYPYTLNGTSNSARWIIAGIPYLERAKRDNLPIEEVHVDDEITWRKEFMLYPGILNSTAIQKHLQRRALADVQPAPLIRSSRSLRRGTRR